MTTKTAAGLDFLKTNCPEVYQRLLDTEGVASAAQPGIGVAASAPVDAVAASSTLTSDNTAPGDGDTVTIDTKVYTFKTALTPLEGEVLINSTADAALLNLIRAINHSGTPNTDYKVAAAHPTVSAATSVTSHTFVITALTNGVVGNAIATAETSAHLSFTSTVLAGGINGTVGYAGQVAIYNGAQPYICLAAATISTAGAWKKFSVAGL